MIDDLSALRDYVARLEGYLAKEELEHEKTKLALEKARKHISDQAIDIVTLGQEVGRLIAELENITKVPRSEAAYGIIQCLVCAALAEKEEKR